MRNDIRNVVLFLGSTIGNLTFDEAVAMLRDLREVLSDRDLFFLGADLRKGEIDPRPRLRRPARRHRRVQPQSPPPDEPRARRDFDLAKFTHRAFYDEERGRIEMHLVSSEAQSVRIGDYEVRFAAGETIHTENSYKYDDASLERLATASGFTITRTWLDSRGWFADALLGLSDLRRRADSERARTAKYSGSPRSRGAPLTRNAPLRTRVLTRALSGL